jgi:RHS repeat-associated protein
VYQYKDHLGNVRLSYSDKSGDNTIQSSTEIIEETNYYPFGLAHKGYNQKNDALMKDYKYQYNGKEKQEELGLNFYDYGARNYDAAIGRWMNVDPLAEKRQNITPYQYASNNPIIRGDVDGMLDGWYEDEIGMLVYNPNVNSQSDLDNKNIDGDYIDQSFVGLDNSNNTYFFNNDGKVEIINRGYEIAEGTLLIEV